MDTTTLALFKKLEQRIRDVDLRQGGPRGPKGRKGDSGNTGPAGPSGKHGVDGRDGRDGAAGKTGAKGADGARGPAGVAGAVGPAGPRGADGNHGLVGADGRDGVSVLDAQIDIDGNLTIYLSDGSEIDAGRILSDELSQQITYISNSGAGGRNWAPYIEDLQEQIDKIVQDLADHIGDFDNPHQVRHQQLPDTALDDSHPMSAITGLIADQARQDQDLVDHETDLDNPHETNWDNLLDKPATFPPSPHTLGSHSDVTLASPVVGESLIFDPAGSGDWINGEARHQLSEANPTGLINGGELNIGPGANDIEVIAGLGVIIDAYTNPDQAPVVQGIDWPQINEAITVAPPVAGSTAHFTIYDTGQALQPINGRPINLGALRQYAEPPTEPTRRDEIYLGVAVHNGDSWGEISSPIVVNNASHTLAEFLKRVAGPTFVIDGGTVLEAPVFTIDQEAGTVWEHNRNWHVNPKDPHREAIPETIGIQWKYVNRDFSSVSALTSTVDPTQYDDGGTITPIPGNSNRATIQQLYQDPRDNFWVLWGQQFFDNATEAAASVVSPTEVPPLLNASVLLGYLVVEKGQNDWDQDEAFILYPQGGGGTGGGGVPITTYLGLADTPGAYTGDKRKVATVDELEANLFHDYRSKYVNNYAEGSPYYPQEWVSNSAWISIANAVTTEPAFPQEVGELQTIYPDSPPFIETSQVAQVRSGYVTTFTQNGEVRSLEVWVPEIAAEITYALVIVDDPNGTTPSLTRIPLRNDQLTPAAWSSVAVGGRLYTVGSEVLVYLESLNKGNSNTVSGGWTYNGQSNTAPPATSGWNHNIAKTIVRIDKTDLDTVDRSSELSGIVTGSTLLFAETANPQNAQTYITLSPPVDQGTYFEYAVTLTNETGSLVTGVTTTFTGTVPVAQATKFVFQADKFLNYPAWADISSFLQYDDVDQPVDQNIGYGINFDFQQLSKSDDWDLIPIGGGGGGGGGDFTPTIFAGAGTTGYVPDPINETGRTLKDDGTWSLDVPAHTHDASEIVSGTMADARIAESNVTQHEAALTIDGSQLVGTIDGGTF